MRTEHKEPASKIEVCCSLLGHSRQAYYGGKKHVEKKALQEELIAQRVIAERKIQKRLGGRKLFIKMHDFLQEQRIKIGRDTFFSVLEKHHLLLRRRNRKVMTTNSRHCFKKYPNLIREFEPIFPNQLWVADITYIRIGAGFGYLSLITDGYSRKIVGFCLSRDYTAKGCIAALKMGLDNNKNIGQLIHHSDRGTQYCCHEYVALLNHYGVKISMTEKKDPLENAIAERLNGILKMELLEEIFPSFEVAKLAIAEAVNIYNNHRPHSSISNYYPEQAHTLYGVELKRLWKNYYKPLKKEVEIQAP